MLAKIPKIERVKSRKFDCIQRQFAINTSNCWFASALASYANNVSHDPITIEFQREVERKAYEMYIMPKRALTVKGGIDRIAGVLDTGKDTFHWRGLKFMQYLKKGYVITVGIKITDELLAQRWSGKTITNTSGPRTAGHIFCLFQEGNDYYCLNSRGGDPIRKLESLDLNIFEKNASCGVILPKEK